jgi:hypothetical protein
MQGRPSAPSGRELWPPTWRLNKLRCERSAPLLLLLTLCCGATAAADAGVGEGGLVAQQVVAEAVAGSLTVLLLLDEE